MASALMILFLGCWLAGQSGVSGERTDTTETPHPDSTMMEPEEEWGTGLTQPGQTSVPTRLRSVRPGGSERSPVLRLTSPIVVVVSAAAAGLLLLLVAFLCYRRTRGGKGPAPRQTSTSPLGVLKTPAQEAPVYSNIDNGKEMQTLPKEPDSGTYAELDRQTLQPSVYDTINMSQGVPQ